MRFSLCIEPVFQKHGFYERIKMAAELGFDAFEFWHTAGRDAALIAGTAAKSGISVAAFCLKGKLDQTADEVAGNAEASIRFAAETNCGSLIGLAGAGRENELVHNLKLIADMLVKAEIDLNIEALNSITDHRGTYLDRSEKVFRIIREVGCPRIKMLYDIYHMQIMEGNITGTIVGNIGSIGHIHSAGVPGRNEHFRGEIDYANILRALGRTSYNGCFGLEYWPTYDDGQSVKDVMEYLKAAGT